VATFGGMAKISVSLTLQTTRAEGGHVHGLQIGTGPNLASAVEQLESEARLQAGELAREIEDSDQPDAEWSFRVEGITVAAGPVGCEPDERWACCGTLVSHGRTPWSASYWDSDRR
jgi:hypothetical protein